jgi:hypothetical protein
VVGDFDSAVDAVKQRRPAQQVAVAVGVKLNVIAIRRVTPPVRSARLPANGQWAIKLRSGNAMA